MTDISIVIPVYDDPAGIDETLQSVTKQTYTGYEIIPVDNDSTDETPQVIEEWTDRFPELIQPAVERDVQSSYAARNEGIEQANGEVIAFIDADMTAPPGWLDALESAFSESEVDYLGYEVEVYVPESETGIWGLYDRELSLPSRYYYEAKQFVPTSSLAVRSRVFDEVGLFNEQLVSGGDKEFGRRVHSHPDLETGFTDEIVVYHPARTSFEEQYRKAIRIGRGLAQFQRMTVDDEKGGSTVVDKLRYLLPPDPRRIHRVSGDVPWRTYPVLFAADAIVGYLQLYGAVKYLTEEWTAG